MVTIIGLLSPANKRRGGDGRKEYLGKREEVLRTSTHLVELDLLRGGERSPTVEPLPPGDNYAYVSRSRRRPRVELYRWSLRDRMPRIPVPLFGSDPDVVIDLQDVFESVDCRVGYDYSIDYEAAVEPPLNQVDGAWVRKTLKETKRPGVGVNLLRRQERIKSILG